MKQPAIFSANDIIAHPHTYRFPLNGMDLAASLTCGQCFAWQSHGSFFTGLYANHVAHACADNHSLYLLNISGEAFSAQDVAFWSHYFSLGTDYSALQQQFSQNPVLAKCVAEAPGLRLFNQPFFETLISFIISQNNHIPRITGIVQRLCQSFGTAYADNIYAFPTCRQLSKATLKDLECLRVGFRDKYILDAVSLCQCGRINEAELSTLSYADARAQLMRIKGVGPKVADCVLLYSLQFYATVPMDVWMKRATAELFGGQTPAAAGGYEGIAQLYIFNYARKHLSSAK